MKVFVGYDTREDIAYQVCKHSIKTRSELADVRALKQQELRDAGWYTRPIDKLASTEFTFTRFLIPELTKAPAVSCIPVTLTHTSLSSITLAGGRLVNGSSDAAPKLN